MPAATRMPTPSRTPDPCPCTPWQSGRNESSSSESPRFRRRACESIFDAEGDFDRKFTYLLGLLIVKDGNEEMISLWADDPSQQKRLFEQFVDILKQQDDYTLFHYGQYEAEILRKMRAVVRPKKAVDAAIAASVNVLAPLHSDVYFPTYSNGLKEIGKYLGFSWTDANASGLQSLAWRKRWEMTGRGRVQTETHRLQCRRLPRPKASGGGTGKDWSEATRLGCCCLGAGWNVMKRLHQVLLIGTFLPLCWLAMMDVHELGHVVGAVATGGRVEKVVLDPLTISRTDVLPNPNPLLVVWAGPIVGVLLPLGLLLPRNGPRSSGPTCFNSSRACA